VPGWTPAPPGFRAIWQKRGELAAAKLEPKLDAATAPPDFPKYLLVNGSKPEEDDFIEVHVYGPLHRRAIERVVGPSPTSRKDRTIFADLRRKLREVGVPLEK